MKRENLSRATEIDDALESLESALQKSTSIHEEYLNVCRPVYIRNEYQVVSSQYLNKETIDKAFELIKCDIESQISVLEEELETL